VFKGEKQTFSKFQPIDVKPQQGKNYVLNGPNNNNFLIYQDAYDDSPTNQSIINAFTNYIYGEGLKNVSKVSDLKINQYISDADIALAVQDYKTHGGYALQVIWNSSEIDREPLRMEYIPIWKLGVKYDMETVEIVGYWHSYDWTKKGTYIPKLYPKFTGQYKEENLEILVVKRPTAEPFFPVPDYISGIPWAQVEGELGNAGINHFKNAMSDITVINYNNGRIHDDLEAKSQAKVVRKKVVGTDNQARVIVAFNDTPEEAVVVDRVSPPELNQQNVFYAEEAERKLIVAHSAPPILFSGSNTGGGFSSNADEIEVATNSLYRRHINPMRLIITNGIMEVIKLIDPAVKLEFQDFEEEKLEEEEKTPEAITEEESKFQLFKKYMKW
jgi:uncharacterized protein YnzC (UPF0291/DUF896 family)